VKRAVPREARGDRLDKWLRKEAVALAPRLGELFARGAVKIDGKAVRAERKLWGGETVEIDAGPPRAVPPVDGPKLRVLHDGPKLLVVDKPRGVTVEPERGHLSLVELAASQHTGFDVGGWAAPGVAHRLDLDTTGCVALAKTDDALAELNLAFEQKRVDKRYLVIVVGTPSGPAQLDTPFGRDPRDARRFTTRVKSARRARLSYAVKKTLPEGLCLLEVVLDTGRTHQIRVQLAEAGFPVLGDDVYGDAKHPWATQLGRQALHAERLMIEGVEATKVEAKAPLPDDFAALV
jgi:23S rRNA pseudouridine1911/1915/1917 synthase